VIISFVSPFFSIFFFFNSQSKPFFFESVSGFAMVELTKDEKDESGGKRVVGWLVYLSGLVWLDVCLVCQEGRGKSSENTSILFDSRFEVSGVYPR
jgi:hypothetical protein